MVLLGKRSRGSETGRENKLWREELLPGPSCEDDETSSGTPSKGQQESLFLENPEVLLTLSLGIFWRKKLYASECIPVQGHCIPKNFYGVRAWRKKKKEVDNTPW